MIETEQSAAEAKRDELYKIAYHLYCLEPDWATFFREIFGLHGLIRRNYNTPEALVEFETSEAYSRIQQLLKDLRERNDAPATEPTRVITVRVPKSLHESLRIEAHEHQTSMNKLCISKLLQLIDEETALDP